MRPRMMKLVADHLRATTNLRVTAKTPDDTGHSWIRLTQLGAPQEPQSTTDTVVGYYMQMDCYASEFGGQPEAETMQAQVCAAIIAIDQSVTEATAGRVQGSFYNPDDDFTPARERFIVTATIHGR